MRAGSRAAAALVAAAMASVLAGCGPAEPPPPPPPPPPDIEVPDALLEAPEPPEGAGVPETQAPETPAPPETTQEPAQEEPQATGAGGGAASDVCALLTPAEVEEVLGQPVETSSITDVDCSYTTTGDPLTTTVLLVGLVEPFFGSVEVWRSAVETAEQFGATVERVDGLGDAAVLQVFPGATVALEIKVGSAWLSLQVLSPGADGSGRYAEALRTLAPRALERLA